MSKIHSKKQANYNSMKILKDKSTNDSTNLKKKRKIESMDNNNFTLDDLIQPIKQESKKRKKDQQNQIYFPIKHSFKSSEILLSLIDDIIKSDDPLRLLKGKLPCQKDFNDLNSKKFLNGNDNCYLNFETIPFNLCINKSYLQENEKNGNFSEKIEVDEKEIEKQNEKEYENSLEEKLSNCVIENKVIENIFILRYKAYSDSYSRKEEFLEDINTLFYNIYEKLKINEKINRNVLVYLTILYTKFFSNENKKKLKMFETSFYEDIKTIIDKNELPKIKQKIEEMPLEQYIEIQEEELKNQTTRKSYNEIHSYESVYIDAKQKLNASLDTVVCKGNCCLDYKDLGPLSLEKETWDSECECRKNKIVCNRECPCGKECKNNAQKEQNNKKKGKDVIEMDSWGIDLFTFRNLMDFLPTNFKDEEKIRFVEKVLLIYLPTLKERGWDIYSACCELKNPENFIEKTSRLQYQTDHISIYFSKKLAMIFETVNYSRVNTSRAYSKGLGMYCNSESGIAENEFIAWYFGEIYPPCVWFEKQDIIKSKKLDKDLPDFYNILLERLKNDKLGYDVVIVDPSSKGNFASRMSHSCVSNCNTVLTVVDNEYLIGMYATKNIEKCEELTFNYNSVTEKKKEFLEAICLCGSYNCKGHYLIFSETMTFTETLAKYHNFLQRNFVLVDACQNSQLSERNKELLDRYSIRESILSNAPDWLKKWAALILEFVDFESKILPGILKEEDELSKEKPPKEEKKNGKTTKKKDLSDSSKQDSSEYLSHKKYKPNRRKEYSSEDILILNSTKSFDLNPNKNKKDTEITTNGEKAKNGNHKHKEISFENEDKMDCDEDEKLITENSQINEKSDDNQKNDKFYEFQSRAIVESRIQNIAITIDKVKHILKLIDTNEAPLLVLNNEEIYDHIWGKEDSIRTILYDKFNQLLRNKKYNSISNELTNSVKSIISILEYKTESKLQMSKNNYCKEISESKNSLIEIAKILKRIDNYDKSQSFVFYKALSDILFFYAKTELFFTPNKKYKKTTPDNEILITNRDVTNSKDSKIETTLDQELVKAKKEYDRYYIWGQLVGWFKQTVDKPNASLSAERRGTLSYPDIETFFVNAEKIECEPRESRNKKNGKDDSNTTKGIFRYPYESQKAFLSKLICNPSVMWPVGNEWNFKNRKKIYGTILFDSIRKFKMELDKYPADNKYVEEVINDLLKL